MRMRSAVVASTALMLVTVVAIILGQSKQESRHTVASTKGLEPLSVLEGVWGNEGRSFGTDYSKAGKSFSSLRNECWRSGEFYVCDQFVDGKSADLIVFSKKEKFGTYNNYSIQAAGGSPEYGSLKVEGNTWTYGDPPNQPANETHFRTINIFEKPTLIRYSVQYSRDNQHWITMSEGVETKQK